MTAAWDGEVAIPEPQTRAEKAWNMRLSGATLKQISDTLKYGGAANVENALSKLLREPGPAHDVFVRYRLINLHRCEALMQVVWSRAIRGDKDFIKLANTLMEREARLLGLDAPARVDITASTQSDVALALADLEAQLPSLRAVESAEPGVVDGVVVEDDDW